MEAVMYTFNVTNISATCEGLKCLGELCEKDEKDIRDRKDNEQKMKKAYLAAGFFLRWSPE
jgi:hypothetical protein